MVDPTATHQVAKQAGNRAHQRDRSFGDHQTKSLDRSVFREQNLLNLPQPAEWLVWSKVKALAGRWPPSAGRLRPRASISSCAP
jgi:hypothetical protein